MLNQMEGVKEMKDIKHLTIQDCLDEYRKGQVVIINDGEIVRLVKKGEV